MVDNVTTLSPVAIPRLPSCRLPLRIMTAKGHAWRKRLGRHNRSVPGMYVEDGDPVVTTERESGGEVVWAERAPDRGSRSAPALRYLVTAGRLPLPSITTGKSHNPHAGHSEAATQQMPRARDLLAAAIMPCRPQEATEAPDTRRRRCRVLASRAIRLGGYASPSHGFDLSFKVWIL